MLVTVKAYPAISGKYGEVVCIAGVRIDTPKPEWARLYPVPFRDLPFQQRFQEVYDARNGRPQGQRRSPARSFGF